MVPWHRADEVLDDLALDLDERRDVLGILAWQMGQQPLEVEVMGSDGFSLQRLLIGHDELTQTIHHLMEDVGGTRQSLNNSSRRCAHAGVIFSPPYIALSIRDAGRKRLEESLAAPAYHLPSTLHPIVKLKNKNCASCG